MKINSIKLNNDGLKGLVVNYAQDFTKDGRTFLDEAPGYKRKAPIHQELEDLFESLRPYLLDICGYHEASREGDLLDTTITGITYNNKGFIIVGKKKVLSGDKTIPLITPLLNEPSYPDAEEVYVILDNIYEETQAYMSGLKSMTDEQLVMKFNEGRDDFDMETFNAKSDIEKRDIATKILEDMKAVIFFPEDEEEKGEEGVYAEGGIPALEQGVPEIEPVIEEVEDNFELPPAKFKPAPLKVVDGEDGSFKVVANEERVSTAARKKQA